MSRILFLALSAVLAAAQLRPQDAAVTWWSSPACAADSGSTVVVLEADVCQRVPGAQASYVVRCAGDGVGVISFCDAVDCSACGVTRAVAGAGDCLANDAALFGAFPHTHEARAPCVARRR